jgi:fatty-acid desaturase
MMLREKIEPLLISTVHWLAIPVSVYWIASLAAKKAWFEIGIFVLCDILFGAWGISGTFHRLFSHGSYIAPRWWHWVGGVLGTIALQGYSIVWASVHRLHHDQSDTERDPHSPHFKGPWWVIFRTIYSKPYIRNVTDLMRDPVHVFLFKYYWWIIIGYISLIALVLEPRAILYAWWMPISKAYYASTIVNAFCHGWRDRNVGLRNSNLLGFLTMGEGWHLNHHLDTQNFKCYHGSVFFDIGSWPAALLFRSAKKNKDQID